MSKFDEKSFLTVIRDEIKRLDLRPGSDCFELLLKKAELLADYHIRQEKECAVVRDYAKAAYHNSERIAIECFVCGFFDELVRLRKEGK
jgi:hypothetical protein